MLYNPQQNGVVERKNWPITETIKAMIYDLDFHVSLGSGVQYSCVILNCCPHRALKETRH
jgi:hypothetical protein